MRHLFSNGMFRTGLRSSTGLRTTCSFRTGLFSIVPLSTRNLSGAVP